MDQPCPAKKPKLANTSAISDKLDSYLSLINYATQGPTKPMFRSEDMAIKHYLYDQDDDVDNDEPKKLSGQVKTLISDFIVKEVDTSNKPANLTKLEYSREEMDEINGVVKTVEEKMDVEESKIELEKMLGKEHFDKIDQAGSSEEVTITFDPDTFDLFNDKSNRSKVHTLIRNIYKSKFASTIDKTTNTLCLTPRKGFSGSDTKIDIRDRQNNNKFDKKNKSILRFVLQKKNIDTISCLDHINKICKINSKNNLIKYAGVKDKRGITTQYCTTILDCKKLIGLNKHASASSKFKIGNFEVYDLVGKNHYNLGCLNGNQFCLVIRNVDKELMENENDENQSISKIKNFKNKGFINYFGLQRFGITSPTALIGLAVLKNDYQAAICLALKNYNCSMNDTFRKARSLFTENDFDPAVAQKCCEILGKRRGLESSLLFGLSLTKLNENPNYEKIWSKLPRNFKLLFLHGYQSWLFNQIVNYRLELSGGKSALLIGDLVMSASNSNKIDISKKNKDSQVKIIKTEDDIKNHNFSDLVLPIIGYDVIIPENIKEFTAGLLQKHGISMDNFNHKNSEFKLGGTYRKVFVNFEKDGNFEYDFVENVKEGVDLQDEFGNWVDVNSLEKSETASTSLRIKFTLPSSAYATMAMRQLLFNNDVTNSFED